MSRDDLSRRSVLKGVGAGVAATTVTTTAAGQEAPEVAEYNVGLYADASVRLVEEAAESIDRTIDLDDHGTVLSGLFPTAAVERVEALSAVEFVERDHTARALDEDVPWGIDRVDADALHETGRTGDGATIAVLDTGVDDDHPDLADNVVDGEAFGTECDEPFFGSGNDCNFAWSDDDDHGTHVAGTAAAVRGNDEGVAGGVSTEADVLAGKVLSGDGSGSYSAIADGIRWATDAGADVINMSLGGDSSADTLRRACRYAVDNGVVVVAAAGNSGPCTDCVGYPAKYDSVIAVSATSQGDSLARFSSTGSEVDIAAPGEDVLSTIPPENNGGSSYETLSGTSMASPHVAGAAAQVVAETSLSAPDEVRSKLTDTAEDIGLGDNEQGAGLLDAERAAASSDGNLPAVTTDGAQPRPEFATLRGTLDDLGGATEAEVYFEYGTDRLDESTDRTPLPFTGSFELDATGLSPVTEYQYRAVAEAGDGDVVTGETRSFITDTADGESPPAVDALSIEEAGFFFFSDLETEWTVSDPNGDLAEVRTELLNPDGDTVDSATTSISGAEASGAHTVDSGFFESEDAVRVTVVDGGGATTSETRSL